MGLSFRTARKLWMGLVALLSLTNIFLAVVLWVHGYNRSNNFGALIAIPCFTFVGAIWTIVKKMFFSPQLVCIEATWIFALLPFQILLGLFAFESDVALRSRFTVVYEVLVILVWTNSALVFLYALGLISLALLTQFSCDQEYCLFTLSRLPPSIFAEPRSNFEKAHLPPPPTTASQAVLAIPNRPRYPVWELRVRTTWKAHNHPFRYAYRPRWRGTRRFVLR